ncbi:MAG: hypothetical protein ACREX0_10225, partial [Noviherbaspirillum sp.]
VRTECHHLVRFIDGRNPVRTAHPTPCEEQIQDGWKIGQAAAIHAVLPAQLFDDGRNIANEKNCHQFGQ